MVMVMVADEAAWLELRGEVEESAMWDAADNVAIAIAESWWRLCHRVHESRFEILQAGRHREFTEPSVDAVLRPLEAALEACSGCVDLFFHEDLASASTAAAECSEGT